MSTSQESGWSDERRAQAKALWRDGKSASQIAAEIGGVTRNAVCGFLNRVGLTRDQKARRTKPKTGTFINATAVAHNREKRKFDRPIVERKPPPNAPQSKRLTLEELNNKMCKFSADDGPPWTFCGNDAEPGYSWCEFHKNLCLQEVSVSEAKRRADREARAA